MYAIYTFGSGPLGLTYKKFFTLDGNSSILGSVFGHVGHTSPATLLLNTGILWTIGNRHVMKYGCSHFMTIFGGSCVLASLMGLMHVRSNN